MFTRQILLNKEDSLAEKLFVPEDEFQIQSEFFFLLQVFNIYQLLLRRFIAIESYLKANQKGLIFQKYFRLDITFFNWLTKKNLKYFYYFKNTERKQ